MSSRSTAKHMAALEAYDIDAASIGDLQKAGLAYLTIQQLVALQNHKVDAASIRALREAGRARLTVRQFID